MFIYPFSPSEVAMNFSSPIHVLHVAESFGAGTFTAISCLCRSLGSEQGFRYSIAYGIRPETPEDFTRAFPDSVNFYPIDMQRPIHPWKDAMALRELISVIRDCKPDIVHCHSSKAGVLGRLAARVCGVPSVYTPHSYSFLRTDISKGQKFFFTMVEWLFARVGDAVAACGEEEYELARKLGGKKRLVQRILNAVDLETMDAITPFAWNRALPVAGICGRLTAQRTPKLFFALAQQLQNEVSWVWIGGSEEPSSPSPLVEITPWLPREEALSRVAGLDIYIQTSSWEGLSYSILEAMALGKPVVACKIPANEAIVKHGVTGFLGANAEELAGFILQLAQDPLLREKMGAAGRERIAQRYDTRTAYQAYAELYRDLIARKGGNKYV